MSLDFVPFLVAGTAIMVLVLAARMSRWISDTAAYGLVALSQIAVCLGGFVTGNTVAASISGAAAGYLAWRWWSGGGGDATKRHIRQWIERFRGVRRTAPVSGS